MSCVKSNALDICRLISAADGDRQMQFLNHSEVISLCVRLLCLCAWVWHWSLRRKYGYLIGPYPTFKCENMDISLVHTQRSNAIAQPIPMQMRREAPNSVQWLACLSNNLSLYATTIHVQEYKHWGTLFYGQFEVLRKRILSRTRNGQTLLCEQHFVRTYAPI